MIYIPPPPRFVERVSSSRRGIPYYSGNNRNKDYLPKVTNRHKLRGSVRHLQIDMEIFVNFETSLTDLQYGRR